jgi:hypothetical protein
MPITRFRERDYRCKQGSGGRTMRTFLAAFLILAASASAATAQQVVNSDVDVSVAAPAYLPGKGPRVRIDEAHSNFHTIGGRYAPFAKLLANDGYRVAGQSAPFTAQSLADVDLLIIANAAAPASGGGSAFTDAEIAAVEAWVKDGGALLLIADHTPFAGAAAKLGQAFGVSFKDGYAVNMGVPGKDLFSREHGLGDHPITRGAAGDRAVSQVRTFTGSAFEAPGAEPLITLGKGFVLLRPTRSGVAGPSTPRSPAAGLLQGAALTHGKGRVVVMGEAAMFSSQLFGPAKSVMGFGAEGAEQNPQFALNLVHWLSRRPGY